MSFKYSTRDVLPRLFRSIVSCGLTAGRLRLLWVLEASFTSKVCFEHDASLRSNLRSLDLSV